MPRKTTKKALSTLVIDIGGTGVKMLVLGSDGEPANGRARELTPDPATPEAIIAVCRAMAAEQPPFDRVSVGFPGVVRGGVVFTAPNLDEPSWPGHDLGTSLAEALGKPTRVLNDADLHGYGVIAGDGVELALTLGTGMGAALFTGGHLVPNLELGRHSHRKGMSYEELVGNGARKEVGKRRWLKRVARMLTDVQALFNADHIYVGGGDAKHLVPEELPDNVRVFSAEEGLRGGARLWEG